MIHTEIIGDHKLPKIYYLHGFMGRGDDFESIAKKLPKFCHVLIDLPGHGKTPVTNYESLEDILEGLLDIFKTSDPPYFVIGYSMGGRLTLNLLVNQLIKPKKAIIIAADPGIEDIDAKSFRYEKDKKLLENIEPKKFLTDWYQNPLFGNLSNSETGKKLIDKRLDQDFKVLQKALNLMSVGVQPNLWPILDQIQSPTLYLAGEHDKKYADIGKRFSHSSPQHALCTLKDCAHALHLEREDLLLQQMKFFFRP